MLFDLSLIVRFNLCQFNFYLKLGTSICIFGIYINEINSIQIFFLAWFNDGNMVYTIAYLGILRLNSIRELVEKLQGYDCCKNSYGSYGNRE